MTTLHRILATATLCAAALVAVLVWREAWDALLAMAVLCALVVAGEIWR